MCIEWLFFAVFFHRIARLHVTDGLNAGVCVWATVPVLSASSLLLFLFFSHFLFTIISMLHIRHVLVNDARRELTVYFYHAWQSLAKLTDLYWLDTVLLITCFVTYVLWWHHVAVLGAGLFLFTHKTKKSFLKGTNRFPQMCIICNHFEVILGIFTTMMQLLGYFLYQVFCNYLFY